MRFACTQEKWVDKVENEINLLGNTSSVHCCAVINQFGLLLQDHFTTLTAEVYNVIAKFKLDLCCDLISRC